MILVTGIAGKSGRWFLERLAREQDSLKLQERQFRVVVRKSSDTGLIDKSRLNIEKVYGDLDDINFVKSIMGNVTIILHIAGIYSSLNIVRAAVESNVRWLILVHTTGIYSKYKSASREYLSIENEIDTLINNKNIKLTILRPTMIYGSIADGNVIVFIKMLDKLRFFPVVNHARYFLQPVHEKDLGNAYYQVLINEDKTENKRYNLSGREPIMLIDMFKAIGKYLGKTNVFVSIPFPLAYFGGCLLYIFTLGRIDYREKIKRLVENRAFDHNEAALDFGYTSMNFEEGVQNEIIEYLNG
jgi:nucleoside-diphosphate-sugar epimerase